MKTRIEARTARRAIAAIGATLALALGLASCGGGGGGDGSTVPVSESSVMFGPITGFGSVIVNGVRFDDSDAQVVDDEGSDFPGGRDGLRLGMMVEVRASVPDGAPAAVASRIAVIGELQGPIEAIDASAASFTVFGVTVLTTDSTLYEDVAGFDALSVGDVVEVHGFRNPLQGTVTATRVELKPVDAAIRLRLRGSVESLQPAMQNFVLALGATSYTVDYSAAQVVPSPSALADGLRVKVMSDELPDAGVIRADRVVVERQRGFENRSLVELSGYPEQVTDGGLQFVLEGVTVDASGAAFARGRALDLLAGPLIEVKGRMEDDVLVAQLVKFEDRQPRGSGGGDDENEFEVDGIVTDFVSVAEFTVRGTLIDASGAQFERGTPEMLATGVRVEVEGVAGDGVVAATRVKFED